MDGETGRALAEIKIHARVGELIQGHGSPGRFLVSGPQSFALATVTRLHVITDGRAVSTAEAVSRLCGVKTLRALQGILLVAHGWSLKRLLSVPSSLWDEPASSHVKDFLSLYRFSRESNIPRGKGFSSSSADVLGLLSLLSRFLRLGTEDHDLYRIAAAIEPTDPLLNQQTVLFDSGRGRVLQTLPGRDLALLYFDPHPDQSVDTATDDFSVAMGSRDDSMLAGFMDAWYAGDDEAILKHTTESALTDHRRRSRPRMEHLHGFAMDHRVGLFVAHTGTLMGLLIPMERLPVIHAECAAFVHDVWGATLSVEFTRNAMEKARPA